MIIREDCTMGRTVPIRDKKERYTRCTFKRCGPFRRFLWRHAGSFQLTHKERVVALLDLREQPTSEFCATDRIALQAHELDLKPFVSFHYGSIAELTSGGANGMPTELVAKTTT